MNNDFEATKRRVGLVWQLPLLALAVIAAAVYAYRKDDSAFAVSENSTAPVAEIDTNPNNRPLQGSFIETFEGEQIESDWYVSNFTVRDSIFRNSWAKENVEFQPIGGYTLKLSHAKEGEMPFNGGELQRNGWVQYGRFEIIARSAPGSGAASGFFTHTNSYHNDPHDEIDIEWIGNRTDIVQFNIYHDGVPQGSWKHKVPFDTSKELHHYAFEWTPDRVTWFVDGEEFFAVTSRQVDIPFTPQRLITHLWTGEQYQWHGHPTFEEGASMDVRCVSYTRLDDLEAPKCWDQYERLITKTMDDVVAAEPTENGSETIESGDDA